MVAAVTADANASCGYLFCCAAAAVAMAVATTAAVADAAAERSVSGRGS